MISDAVRDLATGKNFAVLSTFLPNGMIQSQVMWVDADDTHILINTEVHRQKVRNIERDPRATVTIVDSENPYHYAEIRGRVVETVGGEVALAHIEALSQRYRGQARQGRVDSERVILKIAPERERTW